MKTDGERYYRTTALPLAVFLFAKSQQIAGVNPTDEPGKKEFVFVRTDYLEELVDKYKFGDRDDPDLLVNIHVWEYARNTLLDRLYNR